jgi:hypothetical protein
MIWRIDASFGNLRCPLHNSITIVNPFWYRIAAAEKCVQAGIDVLLSTDLFDVKVVNSRIRGVTFISGTVQYYVPCKVVVDASGDAVVAYFAGAKYEMGQPESLKQIIKTLVCKEKRYDVGHSETGKVQPVSIMFSLGNVDTEEFQAYIKEHSETYESPLGYGMHYDTDYLENSKGIIFIGFWEFIEKAKVAGDFDIPRDRVIFAKQVNKGEYMINATRVIDIDPTDPLALSKAELECYHQIRTLTNFFKKYCPGFKDCFLANIAAYTGVRESRRIKGLKTVTKTDIDELKIPNDSIALCGYNVDILTDVGVYFQPVKHAIGVPYGCLVSQNIDGLLVAGRCISTESYAIGLLRAMSTCLALGEAAGTAAVLAVKNNISVVDVNVDRLRKVLVDNGAIVSL